MTFKMTTKFFKFELERFTKKSSAWLAWLHQIHELHEF